MKNNKPEKCESCGGKKVIALCWNKWCINEYSPTQDKESWEENIVDKLYNDIKQNEELSNNKPILFSNTLKQERCADGIKGCDMKGNHVHLDSPTQDSIGEDEWEEIPKCKKLVENGTAICGVKLDCHLHDWRPDSDSIQELLKKSKREGLDANVIGFQAKLKEAISQAQQETILRAVESLKKMEIGYEEAVKICEKTSYPKWEDHKYCCHYKKGFNQALIKAIIILKSLSKK